MKTLLVGLAFFAFTGSVSGQSFSQISLQRQGAVDRVRFVVPREANIRYYLLEGSRDSSGFQVLRRIESIGNSVMPREYSATSHDTSFRYYRIRGVDMSAAGMYSSCLASKKILAPMIKPRVESHSVMSTAAASCTAMSSVCGK